LTLNIAVGKGSSKDPHFIFRDVDDKGKFEDALHALRQMAFHNDWLIYETKRGAHFVLGHHKPAPLYLEQAEALREFTDPQAPHNAVRIYPNDDYKIVQVPYSWNCHRLAHLYMSFLGVGFPTRGGYCEPLRFGIYRTEKAPGVKAHGEERLVKPRV
jgi:hypothetical protein